MTDTHIYKTTLFFLTNVLPEIWSFFLWICWKRNELLIYLQISKMPLEKNLNKNSINLAGGYFISESSPVSAGWTLRLETEKIFKVYHFHLLSKDGKFCLIRSGYIFMTGWLTCLLISKDFYSFHFWGKLGLFLRVWECANISFHQPPIQLGNTTRKRILQN